mgnify:CR=1 FL=1
MAKLFYQYVTVVNCIENQVFTCGNLACFDTPDTDWGRTWHALNVHKRSPHLVPDSIGSLGRAVGYPAHSIPVLNSCLWQPTNTNTHPLLAFCASRA